MGFALEPVLLVPNGESWSLAAVRAGDTTERVLRMGRSKHVCTLQRECRRSSLAFSDWGKWGEFIDLI